ncbi:MAG: SPFH domain-containing protein [Rhizobacter sp.]|nr:SPFH domain-containing protein [Chlorobiales bacterium]
MGIFDALRNEFIEVIEWNDDSRDTIVYKFPDKESDIKYGAQLTVRESQAAILLNEGSVADVYMTPDRYTLTTQNMPVMTKLKGWKYGFQSPFKADVFFFSLKQFTDLKWGTPNPIIVRDPEFKQVRVRARGGYSMRLIDPMKFLRERSGIVSSMTAAELGEQLRRPMVSRFADALAELNVSVLDLARNYTELGEKLRPVLQQEFTPFGLELTNFYIEDTTLPEEVEKFLDKTTQMNMTDMGKLTQFQTAMSIPDAMKGGGAAGDMAGMGAGMAMGQMMAKNMQDAMQQGSSSQPSSGGQPKTESKEEIMKTLKDLAELKTAGVLTEEEFNTKKKELLAKL